MGPWISDEFSLVREDPGRMLALANDIYHEIVPRELAWTVQAGLAQEQAWYVRDDGRLDVPKLLCAFQDFFRQHSEHWVQVQQYHEAGPQLLLQAFLQRVVNGGGRIDREYGLGRGRVDLFIDWPCGHQRIVLELKRLDDRNATSVLAHGLQQTCAYAERCGADEAHLLIFDIRGTRTWAERVYRKGESHGGRTVTVWGL